MRGIHLVVVILSAVGLSACVGVSGGQYQQPYGGFAGDTHLATPYAYRSGAAPYLYSQSHASRLRAPDRPGQGSYRNRHSRRGHDNRRNF